MPAHLLFVDDEDEIRNLLQRHFRLLGYTVDNASSGRLALEKMATGRYEVVVSDIIMPGMLGTDLLAHIRKDYPMTRVIMITGHVTLDHALDCFRRGAETCIFKPLADMSELENAISHAIAWLENWQNKLRILQGMQREEP